MKRISLLYSTDTHLYYIFDYNSWRWQTKRFAIEKVQSALRGRRVAWSILQDWGSCDLSPNLSGPTKISFICYFWHSLHIFHLSLALFCFCSLVQFSNSLLIFNFFEPILWSCRVDYLWYLFFNLQSILSSALCFIVLERK